MLHVPIAQHMMMLSRTRRHHHRRRRYRSQVPLHFAANARKNALEACKALLGAGAKADVTDGQGRAPYEYAEDDDVRTLLGGPDSRYVCMWCDAAVEREGEVTATCARCWEGRTPDVSKLQRTKLQRTKLQRTQLQRTPFTLCAPLFPATGPSASSRLS